MGFRRSWLPALVTGTALLLGPPMAVPAAAAAPNGPGTPEEYETYLENPEMTGEGQRPAHAILRPYASAADAARGDETTPFVRSLDGRWRFAYADHVRDAPTEFAGSDVDLSDWDRIEVPGVWQQQGYDSPIYRNVSSEIAPYDPPRVPDDMNPVGTYARDFTIPESWDGRRQLLRFEGVTSGFFVWVNGKYLGYDQGGMTPAEFDITDAIHTGRNRIAVRVFRWGSGAYLENFDMWHLSGIFRSVSLYSVPQTWIDDLTVRTDLDGDYRDAQLSAAVDVAGEAGTYQVRGTLLDPQRRRVATLRADVTDGGTAQLSTAVADPAKWTDETPNRYTLVLELLDADGRLVHVTQERFGFREVTVADRQVRVNGVPVDFRGVNRHEHDPSSGRHVPRERMVEDVKLMKRNNVNAVRTSHYPNDPAWNDLADEYGLWLVDEVDVETHWRENCSRPSGDPQDCLADRPEWRKAMLDRFTAMLERDKNHPSVVMWSTGNEAGLGAAHYAMAEYAQRTDPTRLLYHQSNSPDGDAPYADVAGHRYPSPQRLRSIAANATKPVVMGEWLHAMGNSLGHYEDMWRIIRDEPALQGGFVWDWVDQGLERDLVTTPDSSGNRIPAYLSGNPRVVDGHHGKGLSFSGLDDWVEVYRDKRLDITDNTLTVDAWVKPDTDPVGDFSIVSKGDRSYALEMQDPDTIEFFIYDGGWVTVTADVPADWNDGWHRVTGTYDGTALKLYVDGQPLGERAHTGAVDWTEWPVNIGRNAQKHGDSYAGRTGNGAVDDVRIYDRALSTAELASGADPADEALLALDFDEFDDEGSYQSYGSSPFLLNGVVNSDRTPQPELAQMKYSHAWLRFTDVDAAAGEFRITNDYRFTDTSDVDVRWSLVEGAKTLAKGTLRVDLAPGESRTVRVPVQGNAGDTQRWLNLDAVLTRPTPWAPAGHTVASEQLAAGGDAPPAPDVPDPDPGDTMDVDDDGQAVTVTGENFKYTFDRAAGTLTSMRSGQTELLERGPALDVWRAPIGNEWANWGDAEGRRFWGVGLDRLRTSVRDVTVSRPDSDRVQVTVQAQSQAPDVTGQGFHERYVYTVDAAGVVTVAQRVEAYGATMRGLPWLPRVGFNLRLPSRYDTLAWYGRGPDESYPDRWNSQRMGVWRGDVDEQVFDYLPPQETGNKTDVAWAALSDGRSGLLVSGDLDVSVDRYATGRDRANYPFLLTDDGFVTFRIDKGVSGLGDTPVPTQPEYRVRADVVHEWTVTLRPLP